MRAYTERNVSGYNFMPFRSMMKTRCMMYKR